MINTDSIPGGESPPAANSLSAGPEIPSSGPFHFSILFLKQIYR